MNPSYPSSPLPLGELWPALLAAAALVLIVCAVAEAWERRRR